MKLILLTQELSGRLHALRADEARFGILLRALVADLAGGEEQHLVAFAADEQLL